MTRITQQKIFWQVQNGTTYHTGSVDFFYRQKLDVQGGFRNGDAPYGPDGDALVAGLKLEEEDGLVVTQRHDEAEQVARDDRDDAIRVRLDRVDQPEPGQEEDH